MVCGMDTRRATRERGGRVNTVAAGIIAGVVLIGGGAAYAAFATANPAPSVTPSVTQTPEPTMTETPTPTPMPTPLPTVVPNDEPQAPPVSPVAPPPAPSAPSNQDPGFVPEGNPMVPQTGTEIPGGWAGPGNIPTTEPTTAPTP